MNKKVKELVERVRLTDEEILAKQREGYRTVTDISPYYRDESSNDSISPDDLPKFKIFDELIFGKAVAQAQLNKVLKEDLAWIDRGKELPRWQDNHLCVDIFSYDAGQQDMLKAHYLPVIFLAEAMKEGEGCARLRR